MKITHPFPPLYDEASGILVLGSFPSVKSREQQFFYGHPQNRFWKVIAAVFGAPVPETIDEKRALILSKHLALYDTIFSCEIEGSSDASIKNAVPTDLSPILQTARIEKICCNGSKSYELYQKYQLPRTGIPAVKLPSTSPANAAWSLDRLTRTWAEELCHQPLNPTS